MALTEDEMKEFKQLKRDLLMYHHLGLTTYNPKKERYNELWDKLVKKSMPILNEYRQMEQN